MYKYNKKYNDFVKNLKINRPVGPFNKLKIKDYFTNERLEYGIWKYQRHHLKEITISGATYKTMPEIQTDDAILVDYIEHFLLHYLIVLAETTTPNHGMIISLIYSGLSIKEVKY